MPIPLTAKTEESLNNSRPRRGLKPLSDKIELYRLALDKLVPVYQPIVRLGEGGSLETVGYEVLSRFPATGYRPNKEGQISLENPIITPDKFYKKIWNVGLGIRAKATLFERVTRDVVKAKKAGRGRRVDSLWFNITTTGLGCPTTGELVAAFRFNFPDIALRFEIHESTRLGDREIEIVNAFQKRGERIALDDWGSPDSDRTRKKLDFQKLNADIVKLDRGLLFDPERLKREVGSLRKKGVAQIVAEGIESDRDLELVRSLGIEMGQGYYFGKPGREIVETIDR